MSANASINLSTVGQNRLRHLTADQLQDDLESTDENGYIDVLTEDLKNMGLLSTDNGQIELK